MPVIRATTVSQVLEILGTTPDAVVLAGGTTLMVDVAEGRLDPEVIVTLKRVEELRGIERSGGRVRIGALTTYADLLAAPDLGMLTSAARTVGSPAQRNAGTVGGALVGGPAGDLATALLALDARVRTCTVQGRRDVALAEWLHDPRDPGELVCGVLFDDAPVAAAYLKAGERQAVISASASAAVTVGPVGRVRCAIGGVAGVAVRVTAAEEFAGGLTELDVGALAEFADLVRRGLGWTLHGARTSAGHRRHVAGTLAARALTRALGAGQVAA